MLNEQKARTLRARAPVVKEPVAWRTVKSRHSGRAAYPNRLRQVSRNVKVRWVRRSRSR
jgi:hypothetical protein